MFGGRESDNYYDIDKWRTVFTKCCGRRSTCDNYDSIHNGRSKHDDNNFFTWVITETTTTVISYETTTVVTDDETEPLLCGDVNLDGTVSLADAVKLNKAIAGSVELNETATSSADTNSNGDLEQEDALILLKFLVQYIDTIPMTE